MMRKWRKRVRKFVKRTFLSIDDMAYEIERVEQNGHV